MLDLMQQELDFSRGEALTLASLTVDLIRRPAVYVSFIFSAW